MQIIRMLNKKVLIFALTLIVIQASGDDLVDSRSRRGKDKQEYSTHQIQNDRQKKNDIIEKISKLNAQIDHDEDVVKPVVVEKNHPVEVHLQQKIDDQPSETSAENEGLFANARESGQNDVDTLGALSSANDSVPSSWLPLLPNKFFPFGKINLAKHNNCTWKEDTSFDVVDDEVIQCQKINDKKCFSSQETFFETYSTEVCDETYSKNCHISFEEESSVVPVEICYSETRRVCDNRKRQLGFSEYTSVNETCLHVFETVCESYKTTRVVADDYADCKVKSLELCERTGKCPQVPQTTCKIVTQNVTKEIPESKCRKIAKTICGPEDCPVRVLPELCRNETKKTSSKVPVETCTLTPKRECKDVSVLVPSLVPIEKCIEIPKEICTSIIVPRNITRTASRLFCDNQGPIDDDDVKARGNIGSLEGPDLNTTESTGTTLVPDNGE